MHTEILYEPDNLLHHCISRLIYRDPLPSRSEMLSFYVAFIPRYMYSLCLQKWHPWQAIFLKTEGPAWQTVIWWTYNGLYCCFSSPHAGEETQNQNSSMEVDAPLPFEKVLHLFPLPWPSIAGYYRKGHILLALFNESNAVANERFRAQGLGFEWLLPTSPKRGVCVGGGCHFTPCAFIQGNTIWHLLYYKR